MRAELHFVGLLFRVLASGERVLLQNTEVEEPHARSSEEDLVGRVAHMPVAELQEHLGYDAVALEGLLRTSVEQVVLGHKRLEEVPVVRASVHIVVVEVQVVEVQAVEDLDHIVVAEVQAVEVLVHTVVEEVQGDLVRTSPEQVEVVHPFVADQVAAEHPVDRQDPDVAVS